MGPQTHMGRILMTGVALTGIVLLAYVVYVIDLAILFSRQEKACLAEMNFYLQKRPKLIALATVTLQRWFKLKLARKK